MLRLKPFALLLLGPGLIQLTEAAELTNEIPLDFAQALIELPQTGEVRFYDAPPPSFPEFTVPDGFTFVGGMDMDSAGFARVILKSPHEMSEGSTFLSNSLYEDGYVSMPRTPARERGFLADVSPPAVLNFCNDDKGTLQIRILQRGSSEIFYSMNGSRVATNSDGEACGDQVRERMEFAEMRMQRYNSGLQSELPIMSMPVEDGSDRAGIIDGSRDRGGNDYFETSSQLLSGWPATYIHDHITEQLIDQGWEHVQSLGEGESNWRITLEDRTLFGELVVRQVGENTLNLYFRISIGGLVIEESGLGFPVRIIQ